MTIETIATTGNLASDPQFRASKYQEKLTPKLDDFNSDFDQPILNEIVLWKVNRYAEFDEALIQKLNQIKRSDVEINLPLTKEILRLLLAKEQRGVQLPLASTILRFKNPEIYQIIDQRAYRFLYGKTLKCSSIVEKQIDMYLKYLSDLHKVAATYDIAFCDTDRILYNLDRFLNSENSLKESARSSTKRLID